MSASSRRSLESRQAAVGPTTPWTEWPLSKLQARERTVAKPPKSAIRRKHLLPRWDYHRCVNASQAVRDECWAGALKQRLPLGK
jgi:hypothetical protein